MSAQEMSAHEMQAQQMLAQRIPAQQLSIQESSPQIIPTQNPTPQDTLEPSASPPKTSTPKRKRGDPQPPVTPVKFSFDPVKAESPQQGRDSPRTIVAHRFRGLDLSASPTRNEPAPDQLARKRSKPLSSTMQDLDTHPMHPLALPSPLMAVSTAADSAAGPDAVPEPARRRAGTPPLCLKNSPAAGPFDESVVDPIRAALTWHEDEITIYDPNDDDDDGTGINGIGFKPTPALAHARAAKRRQQMADYRRREDNEARARRSQRRNPGGGGGGGGGGGDTALSSGGVVKKKSPPRRRVRFIDAESQKIALTMV